MCTTCGCSDSSDVRISGPIPHAAPQDAEVHNGQIDRERADGAHSRTLRLEIDVLAKNDVAAQRNRLRLRQAGITSVNLMSTPGAGKTTLLERTVRECAAAFPLGVIEGDQETRLDAERIRAAGAPVVQINTGAGCHLDAEMLEGGLEALRPPAESLLFIENVGNLVCPALFDLGEQHRVVIMSVTEGADKPLKYPNIFARASMVVLNKVDLLPYVEFDTSAFVANTHKVNPGLPSIQVSATTGEGVADWLAWLMDHHRVRNTV